MRILLTLCFFFVLGNAVAQDHKVTIKITDPITEKPADLISAFGIKQGDKGMFEMEAKSKGKYILELKTGKYAFEFKHKSGKTMSVIFEVSGDLVKEIVFSPDTP